MQLIHKSLITALCLLPLAMFSQNAAAGGLKIFVSSGHGYHHGHQSHYSHHSYRTRPGFALSYGTGSRYYGSRHHNFKHYKHKGYKKYSRPHSYYHNNASRYNHSYKHGYRDGYRHGGHKKHHRQKRKHKLGR